MLEAVLVNEIQAQANGDLLNSAMIQVKRHSAYCGGCCLQIHGMKVF